MMSQLVFLGNNGNNNNINNLEAPPINKVKSNQVGKKRRWKYKTIK